MNVYVMRDITLVGRGVTDEDGLVSVYLKDEIYADEQLTIYMNDPYEILDEHVMNFDAPAESTELFIVLNEEISGGWWRKVRRIVTRVAKVAFKVLPLPGKLLPTILTKVPGLSGGLQKVMKFTGATKVFTVLGKVPAVG